MRFENIKVYNIENAIRGMRNPMMSHVKSDSFVHEFSPGASIPSETNYAHCDVCFDIGEADHGLASGLITAGEPHRKFLRQIFVSVDLLKVPSYWMHEFATYKIGTTLDCSSTMHKITSRPLTADDFEAPETDIERQVLGDAIEAINISRDNYLLAKGDGNVREAEAIFRSMKRMLPHSYLYERMTWTANYEVLTNIWYWRHNHRLPAWREFCENFIERLPYSEFITKKSE